MKKFGVRIISFLVVLAGLVCLASFLVKPKGEDAYNIIDVNKTVDQLNAEADNSLDVLFVGDSLVYTTYSPMQMWGEQGFTSFNCGTVSQRLCDSYAILSEAFKNQRPKVVLLGANSIYRKAGAYEEADSTLSFFNQVFPYLHYHNFYKLLKSPKQILSGSNAKNSSAYLYKGFQGKKGVKKYDPKGMEENEQEDTTINTEVSEYILKIKALCEENGASLLLISTPSPINWNTNKSAAVHTWSNENGVDYLDMNEKNDVIDIDWNEDSVDGGDHLNLSGSKKVSTYIASYIKENYILEDHREDDSYQEWARLYQKYSDQKFKDQKGAK